VGKHRIEIVPATRAHAEELVDHLRPADVREIEAGSIYSVRNSVIDSVGRSIVAWALLIDERVAAVGGVVALDLISGRGQPWVLTTVLVDKHPRIYLRALRRCLPWVRARFPRLINLVDGRYRGAYRLAHRMGFQVSEPFLFGARGQRIEHRWIEMRG
jgi:hypothetical protein